MSEIEHYLNDKFYNLIRAVSIYNKRNILSCLPVLLAVLIVPLSEEYQLTILMVSLFSCYIYIQKAHLGIKIRNLILMGFLIRIIIVIIDHSFHFFPYVWDDFYTAGVQIKQNFVESNPIFYNTYFSAHVRFYGLINAIVYMLLDNYEILMRIMCSLWGVLAAERVYRLSKLIFESEKSALISAAFMLFWPSIIVFNSLNMRDSLILFLTMDILWRFGGFYISKKYIQLFVIPIVLFVLYYLRMQNLFVYGSTIILFSLLLFYLKSRRLQRFLSILSLSCISIVFVYFLINSDIMKTLLSYANTEMAYRASGGSAYLSGMHYDSWFDIILFAPIRVIYFTFGPFPWQIQNIFMFLGSFEALLIIIMIFYSVKGFKHHYNVLQLKYVYLILLFSVLGITASALIDSNYGTAIRHRINYIFIFFLFSANYLKDIKVKIG